MTRSASIALTIALAAGVLALLDPDAMRISRLNEGEPTLRSDLAHSRAGDLAGILDEWSFRLQEIRCDVQPPAESDNTPRARACRYIQEEMGLIEAEILALQQQ